MSGLSKSSKSGKVFIYIIITLIVLLWILPIWSSLLASLKGSEDFSSQRFYELPKKLHFFDNVKVVLRDYRLHMHLISSAIYSICGAVVAIFFGSTAAYSLVRLNPRFKFFLFFFIYIGTLFPFQMYLIPLYKMFNQTGIYNTRAGMLLLYSTICIPFSLFVFRGFYTTIPKEIGEAAYLDGCSSLRSYFSIFLPQSVAPIAIVALFQASWIWNDLLFGMVLTQSERIRPIMIAIASMTGVGGGFFPYIMTGVVIASIPTILLYIFLQKYFISGMTLSVVTE